MHTTMSEKGNLNVPPSGALPLIAFSFSAGLIPRDQRIVVLGLHGSLPVSPVPGQGIPAWEYNWNSIDILPSRGSLGLVFRSSPQRDNVISSLGLLHTTSPVQVFGVEDERAEDLVTMYIIVCLILVIGTEMDIKNRLI